jgi:hypothetical protein
LTPAPLEMRRELIANDRGNAEQARLLEESAQIVTSKETLAEVEAEP